MNRYHRRLYTTCSLAFVGMIPMSFANTTQNTTRLDEIVVTATKSGEVNAQQVPAAITVVSEDTVERRGIQTLQDLQGATPSLHFSRNGQSARIYLRGVGSNLDFIGSDPSVAVHVDGVYQPRAYQVFDHLLDVERIEIIRGPQGMLYGRNATGGTLNIISRTPGATSSGLVSLEGGNHGLVRLQSRWEGALIEDTANASIAILHSQHDPYIDNLTPAGIQGLSDDNAQAARAALLWQPSDSTRLTLRGDIHTADDAGGTFKSSGLDTQGNPAPLAASTDIPPDPFQTAISRIDPFIDPFIDQTSSGVTLSVDHQLSTQWNLTSITGLRRLDFAMREDTDGTALNILQTDGEEDLQQISQELQIRYQHNQLTWTGGLFLLQEDNESRFNVHQLAANRRLGVDSELTTQANAVFTQARYAVTEELAVHLGVRFSYEEKDFDNAVQLRMLATDEGGEESVLSAFEADPQDSWQAWSPHLGIEYQYLTDHLMYARVDHGFKSGGYNMTSPQAAYDQEDLLAYQAGIKSDWLSGQARTNLALFHYDYDDLQVQDFVTPGVLFINNAASASVTGVEWETTWYPTYALRLDIAYTYLDATYDRYLAPAGDNKIDVSGNRLNNAPRHHLYLAGSYGWERDWGLVTLQLSANWQDDQFFTAFNQPVSGQKAFSVWHAQLSWQTLDNQWAVQLWGKNLGNRAYALASREFTAAATGVTKDIQPPRTLGIKLTRRL